MAEKLTDRTAKTSNFADADVFHLVDVSDTSQDPAGSSFKVESGDYFTEYLEPKINSLYIPVAGTSVGNPVTGDIEFDAGSGIILNNGSILREGTTDAGASGGIAQICGVGYELKWEAGSQYVMDNYGTLIREVNHKFDTAPTVTNDATEGFYVGSRWILDDGTIYTCTDDSTGLAVWDVQFPVISLKVNLSAAEIKTLNSVPIDIGLPSSGIGYYYRVTAFDCKLNFGTVAFTSTQLGILSTTGGNGQLTWSPPLSVTNTVFSTSFITPNVTDNLVENDTISILTDADSAVGDSTIECYISVQKIKL